MRKLICFIFIATGLAFGQGGAHSDQIIKSTSGQAGTVRVCTAAATGTPCAPLATIYSDSALSTVIAGSIVTTDVNGNYSYWAAPGNYKEQAASGSSRFTRYVSVGDPVGAAHASGNETIAGNKTLTGATTFSGTVAVTGDFSGLTGAFKKLNGVFMADQYAGANVGEKLSACLAAAVAAGGGICDARGLPSGTIASQIDVGSNATPNSGVTLLLPKVATWAVNMNSPTACGIMLHDKSTIIGNNGQGNGNLMVISAEVVDTNVAALVCTDPSPVGGGSYIRADGFGVSNNIHATLGSAVLIQSLFDNSVFRDIAVANSDGIGMRLINACCGVTFYNLLVDGQYGVNARPLVIGNSGTGVNTISFNSISATHPGATHPAIEIGADAANENINFYNLYVEPNDVDTTTATVMVGANAHNINIYGGMMANIALGSAAYFVDLATWAGPSNSTFSGMKSQTLNVINDHVASKTIAGDATYGANALYISGSSTLGTVAATSVAIGGGSSLTWYKKATHASLDLASVSTNVCSSENTETISGVALGDSCSVSAGTAVEAGGFFKCAATATDTVKWQFCNLTAGSIDRASDTYTIRVIR